jgi:hypothetical protein
MPKNKDFYTFDELVNRSHKEGATLIDFNGKKVPCIYVEPRRYDEIMTSIYGKKLVVDTVLDIFHDGQDVFVDFQFSFLEMGIKEECLLHANNMLEFFEALSKTGLIALAPNLQGQNSSNVFMVQLPKKELAENAFLIIKANIKDDKRTYH